LLGHETSHVVNRDVVYNINSCHNKTVCYKIIDIILAPTSVFFGLLGDLTQMGFYLLHASTITGYGRNIEARADKEGMRWAIKAGYDPQEAASTIEIFLKEKDKYQKGQEIFFLMNHPTSEWRLKKLKKIISEEYIEKKETKIKTKEFLNIMTKVKLYNATLNIRIDRLEHASDNIQWVLEEFPNNPEAHYLAGEIFRLKAEDKNKLKDELSHKGWKQLNKGYKKGKLERIWFRKAMEEYNCAIECDSQHPHSYKGLALLQYHKNNKQEALENLRRYLKINSNAKDKRYIVSLIKRITKEVQIDKDKREREKKK